MQGPVRTPEWANAMQAMPAPCTDCASLVQMLCKVCKWLQAGPSSTAWDRNFSGWAFLGMVSREWCPCLCTVCAHTEQSRWLALETRSRYCDKTPATLQQKEIQETAVTNAREKRLFGVGGRQGKKKPCLFWRNTYIPSNKSSLRLFLYLRRNRNRHNQGLKRLEITS